MIRHTTASDSLDQESIRQTTTWRPPFLCIIRNKVSFIDLPSNPLHLQHRSWDLRESPHYILSTFHLLAMHLSLLFPIALLISISTVHTATIASVVASNTALTHRIDNVDDAVVAITATTPPTKADVRPYLLCRLCSCFRSCAATAGPIFSFSNCHSYLDVNSESSYSPPKSYQRHLLSPCHLNPDNANLRSHKRKQRD